MNQPKLEWFWYRPNDELHCKVATGKVLVIYHMDGWYVPYVRCRQPQSFDNLAEAEAFCLESAIENNEELLKYLKEKRDAEPPINSMGKERIFAVHLHVDKDGKWKEDKSKKRKQKL